MTTFRGIAIPSAGTGGGGSSSSRLVQVVNTTITTSTTITATTPLDDTIPQTSETGAIMSCSITPTSATNKLKITVMFNGSVQGGNGNLVVGIWQDANTGATAVVSQRIQDQIMVNTPFVYYMTAGTISATTFTVRGGTEGGLTLTVNGRAGARIMGGATVSSITIEEILV